MIRLLLAAVFLAAAAAPTFACPRGEYDAFDNRSRTANAQPADQKGAPPAAARLVQGAGPQG